MVSSPGPASTSFCNKQTWSLCTEFRSTSIKEVRTVTGLKTFEKETYPLANLNHKVALITGSGRGIGKAIAERYASLGANITVNYTNNKAAAELTVSNLQAYGVKALALQADIGQVAEVRNMFQTTLKEFGKIDIVVANAGIEVVNVPTVDITEEQYDRLFEVNTKGAFFTIQEAAKHVADNGRIIYVSSSTTASAMAGYALYGSSKVAPMYLVETLAKEIGYRGVTVNTIVPTSS